MVCAYSSHPTPLHNLLPDDRVSGVLRTGLGSLYWLMHKLHLLVRGYVQLTNNCLIYQ